MKEVAYKQRVSSKELAFKVDDAFSFVKNAFERDAQTKIEEIVEIIWIPLFDDFDQDSGITGIEFIARGYNYECDRHN